MMKATLVAVLAIACVTQVSAMCQTQERRNSDPAAFTYGPTCQDLADDFPSVLNINPPQDRRILCPFLRMQHRVNSFGIGNGAVVSVNRALQSIRQFGCANPVCQPVAAGVAALQGNTTHLNLRRLAFAPGVSHDCGFTFPLGASRAQNSTIEQSLRFLRNRANNGWIRAADLTALKREACRRDLRQFRNNRNLVLKNEIAENGNTLVVDDASAIEVQLIWAYLGGPENGGRIRVQDVRRFFYGQMPFRKTKYQLTGPYLAQVASFF